MCLGVFFHSQRNRRRNRLVFYHTLNGDDRNEVAKLYNAVNMNKIISQFVVLGECMLCARYISSPILRSMYMWIECVRVRLCVALRYFFWVIAREMWPISDFGSTILIICCCGKCRTRTNTFARMHDIQP